MFSSLIFSIFNIQLFVYQINVSNKKIIIFCMFVSNDKTCISNFHKEIYSLHYFYLYTSELQGLLIRSFEYVEIIRKTNKKSRKRVPRGQ